MSSKLVGLAIAMACTVAGAQAQTDPCAIASDQVQVISRTQALQLAYQNDLRPELASAEIRAARTERAVAAMRPQDTVSIEIEDFPGTGLASNIDSLQITGSFSRVWERGGKRAAREQLAERTIEAATAGLAAAQLDIREEVETLYIEVSIAEKQLQLACDRIDLSRDLETVIQRRVEAARDPLLAGARATSDRLNAEADARRAAAQLDNLRSALGAYWLETEAFRTDPDFLELRRQVQSFDISTLSSPRLDQLAKAQLKSAAQIELEKAQAIPDITWSVGVRKFGFEEDAAVIAGASIPLGAGKRSEAAVAKARAEQAKLEVEREAVRQQLIRRAAGYQRAALSALEQIDDIDSVLLPAALEAIALARDGYARGAFSYLDIINAQAAADGLRAERLNLLRIVSLNEAALGRLAPADTKYSPTSEKPE